MEGRVEVGNLHFPRSSHHCYFLTINDSSLGGLYEEVFAECNLLLRGSKMHMVTA